MLAACLLLAIAIVSGTMLTFLFDRSAPSAARICMGAGLGLALEASIGFVVALCLGLNAASIVLSAGVMLLPLLLLLKPVYRAWALSQFRPAQKATSKRAAASPKTGSKIGYWVFYIAIAVLLGMVFNRAIFERPDGIFTGIDNNLGDLPLHLQVINSFAQGHNLPPEDPTYAGVRFAYPFLVDFLAAMLVRAGAGVIGAMWLENMIMALALVGSLHYWTLLLTRNTRAGILAPLLVIFSGGLGWWLFFTNDLGGVESFSFFSAPPHDYTILPNSILRWGNSLTTLFVPQRSILFGIPLAVFIFSQWWLSVSEQESVLDAQTAAAASTNTGAVSRRKTTVRNVQQSAAPAKPQSTIKGRMAVAGACAGLLPLIHAHTFLVVMAAAVCLAILFRTAWRSWTLFFAVAIPLSLPEIWWLAHTGGVNAKSYLGWQPGWDHGEHNVLWFWFVNAGPFILALLAALLWRGANFSLPRRLIKFYIPFLFCFIIPNLVKLAPWVWDNIKVLFLWYIASTPLVALLLARWWEQRSRWRWLAPVVFGSMILAGSLDILRVIAAGTEQREFEPTGIAIARSISEQAAPQARVLHAPTYNTPVFLTGRRSLLGYPGWMWSRGLDFTERDSDIRRIYAGGTDAGALLEKYQVDYILVGPQERGSFPVNEQFLSQYKKVAQAEAYQLYQIKMERLRTGK